ncbi:hypothetical protein [Streptomyces sp. NPDC051173]|uniref:hypothetical protein n=1 Tax=Streptomyces sp. NPDC051173 TaxID=3155164 RepID=UPI003450C09C
MNTDQTVHAPWGIVSPSFWHTAGSATPATAVPAPAEPGAAPPAVGQTEVPPPPAEYRWRIAAVTAACVPPVDPQRLAVANVEAEQIDREFTAAFGAAHSHTINVRELRGWIAHLMGQPAAAARWYLHTTGLQAHVWGTEHEFTRASAGRAVQQWKGVTDPAERLALGSELLPMLRAVTGETSDATLAVQAVVEPPA